MPYDIFISYSRRDNETGRVTELKHQIEQDYLAHTGEDLLCFFDKTEIRAMEDWRNRILGGLRESKILILVLSPEYLKSHYCEWEIVEFLKYEHSRFVQGQGVAQVYFVEIPGLDTPGFNAQCAAWMARVRQRNHVDLRPWYHAGADSLNRDDVQTRLEDLERSLMERLSRLRCITIAPGNMPAHNPRFVGRTVEMDRLHKSAGLGQFGLLTAVQGVGGMGKTALAIQYAHAYADFYPGGRWLVGCAGISTLVQAIRSLDSDLGIQFTDEEKLDETRAAKRVLSVLQQKAEDGAKARAGEKKPPEPKVLLILDNVDAPALLQPPGTDLISGRRWLHAIVTTRLNPEALGADQALHCHLPVDELPEEDAIRLIESWQPMGLFLNDMERNAALGIARLLGGFTLAIEVAAVYLADSRGRVTCSALLQRLEKQGVDPVGRETKSGIRHAEKLISATLTPTLETLETRENFVLTLAALLPPDAIVLPWLKATAAKKYPEFATDAEPGYIDPWLSIINHLLGLRLLQALDWTDDGKTLRICRMHRLVQTVVRQSTGDAQNPLLLVLVEIASERAEFLCNEEGWLDWNNRWEIHPLGQLALHLLDDGKDEEIAAYLASVVATLLHNLGDWEGAQLLDVRALEARERVLGAEHPDTLLGMSNLATLLHNKGEHEKAQPLFERALEVQERVLGLEHPDTLWSVNKLAAYFCSNGNFEKAHHLLDRAQEACERILGSEHPDTLYSVNILAALFHNKGDHEKALSLYERALEARERVLGSEHPDTLISVNNLAKLFHDKGEFEKAQTLYERALEGYERVLGPEHPNTLMIVDDLAVFFYNKGEFEKAQPLYERVLEARERVLGSEHPDTLLNISNLATLLHNKGDHEKALSLHERALEARERVLGSEHPDTLMSVSNLAGLFHDKGEFEKAQPLYERALEARERVLGPEHPSTLLSMSNLAGLFHDKGEFEKAQPLYERALEARERVLGVEHPSTKIVRRNLEILFDTIRQ